MLKKSISCIWVSYFFLEYPFGTPYLELSSEIPAQDSVSHSPKKGHGKVLKKKTLSAHGDVLRGHC